MTKSQRKNVLPDMRIALATIRIPGGRASDRATALDLKYSLFSKFTLTYSIFSFKPFYKFSKLFCHNQTKVNDIFDNIKMSPLQKCERHMTTISSGYKLSCICLFILFAIISVFVSPLGVWGWGGGGGVAAACDCGTP